MRTLFKPVALLCLLLLILSIPAMAERGERGERGERYRRSSEEHERAEAERGQLRGSVRGARSSRQYIKECSACHVAYPPAFLPRQSWNKIMTSLDSHFGDNASLDAKTAKVIQRYLDAHSHPSRLRHPPLRITKERGFLEAHHRLSKVALRRHGITSMSNCAACHVKAAQWEYEDGGLKLPRRDYMR